MAINQLNADVPARHYLREWREHRGYSQHELGQMVGATGGTISRYEKGDRGLPLEFLLKLFEALDILPGQFFGPPEAPSLDSFALPLAAKDRRALIELVEIASGLTPSQRQELLAKIRTFAVDSSVIANLSPESPQSTPAKTV